MGSNNQNRPGMYEDANSREYDSAARQYASIWQDHNPDRSHYHKVQSGIIKWYSKLQGLGIKPESGALVICGPGFDISNRDLSGPIIDSTVKEHPSVIVADWSTEALDDAYDSLSAESRQLGSKLQLTRRDFSGGLSAKTHSLLADKIEDIRDPQALRDFVKWLSNEVGLDEVRKHQPAVAAATGEYHRRVSQTLDVQEAMDFNPILQGRADVRFITANMLLAGTFALTEKEFRDRLMELQPNVDEDEMVEVLRLWHEFILSMNNEVAANFVMQGLELNPNGHIFAPTDIDVHYAGLDKFTRLDVDALRSVLATKGYKLKVAGQWTQDDTHEFPSHTHEMNLLLACRNGSHQDEASPTSATQGAPTSGKLGPEMRLSVMGTSAAARQDETLTRASTPEDEGIVKPPDHSVKHAS